MIQPPRSTKNTPKLRFPEFTNSWQQTNLGDAIEEIAMGPFGSNLKVDMFTEKGVPIIKGGNLQNTYVSGPYSFVSEDKASSLGKSVAYPGDFIVTHRGTLGQVSLVSENGCYERYVTSQSQLRFRVNSKRLSNGWLIQYLRSVRGNRRMLVDAGQVGVPAISFPTSSIKSVLIIAPNIEEQQKIADFLTDLDEKISVFQKKIELLKDYRKGVIHQVFSQKIRFKNKNGRHYPEWEERTLGIIGSTYTGLTGKKANDFGEGSFYITYKQIFDSSVINIQKFAKVGISSNENQNKAKKGDIFFTISSETPEEVGFSSVLLNEIPNLYLNSFCFGYRVKREIILPEFAQFLFRTPGFRRKVIRLAQGSTRYNLSKSELMKITINIPRTEEQEKIYELLISIDDRIQLEERRLAEVKRFKKSLLQQMFI